MDCSTWPVEATAVGARTSAESNTLCSSGSSTNFVAPSFKRYPLHATRGKTSFQERRQYLPQTQSNVKNLFDRTLRVSLSGRIEPGRRVERSLASPRPL